jgi:hypothetical protein
MLLVIVLIAIGFMIMFRMKLNPQTIITVESALPRIVLSLILITFSFAIAGFMIDLMYVIIIIVISLLSNGLPKVNVKDLQNTYVGAGFIDLWPLPNITDAIYIGSQIVEILPDLIRDNLKGIVSMLVTFFIAQRFTWPITGLTDLIQNVGLGLGAGFATINGEASFSLGNLVSGTAKYIPELLVFLFLLPFAAGILVGLLFIFTLLFFMFRVFFLLLSAYLKILLLIIVGPIFCLFEAIPGRSAFGYWFKQLFTELLTFPTVIMILILGRVVMEQTTTNAQYFSPPFLYHVDETAFKAILGMGLILMIPELVGLVKQMFGVKQMPVGINIGSFLGGAGVAAGGAFGILSQYGSLLYTLHYAGLTERIPDFLRFLPGLQKDPIKTAQQTGQSQLEEQSMDHPPTFPGAK